MATKVVMEALSPTMEEGRLVKWNKNEGDQIKAGDVLAEVETDKAVMELVARGDGVLRKRLANEGDASPVGTLLAVFLASLGILISVFSSSNRVSLSVGLFVLLALFAPSQLPSSAQSGWAGDLLLRVNPLTAGEHYVGKIVVSSHGWQQDASWLVSPVLAAVLVAAAGLLAGSRFVSLRGGGSA